MIKNLARWLAADPDVLFRLSSSTDPDVVDYLHGQPDIMYLLRFVRGAEFTELEIKELITAAESIKSNNTP